MPLKINYWYLKSWKNYLREINFFDFKKKQRPVRDEAKICPIIFGEFRFKKSFKQKRRNFLRPS